LAIMPTTEPLTSFISALTPGALADITTAATDGPADLRLPRFTTTSSIDLTDTLAALGMPDAFGGKADFTAMSPVGVQISAVQQRVYLKVSEAGTEAAAVTGIGVAGAGNMDPPLITLDHPFLFLIRDTTTGAILFAAQVENPTD
jgi:serpin B